MKIQRAELVRAIKLLQPAVASKSPIDGLTHIWFDGAVAVAYNDIIGIETPCDLPLVGGVAGGTLLGLLDHAAQAEVDVAATEKELVLKFGGSKAKLPVLSPDRAILPFTEDTVEGIEITAELHDAINHVMLSVSESYSNAGITLMVENTADESGALALYSTDGKTVSWARVPLPEGYEIPRVVLSESFCKQLLLICKGGGILAVVEDSVLAVAEDGTRLFGRLLEPQKELNYLEIILRYLPEGVEPTPLPDKLDLVLERTRVLSTGEDVPRVIAVAEGGVLRCNLKTSQGELHEALRLEKPHPPNRIELVFDASLIQRGMMRCGHFMLSETAFIMLGSGDQGFMAASPAPKA